MSEQENVTPASPESPAPAGAVPTSAAPLRLTWFQQWVVKNPTLAAWGTIFSIVGFPLTVILAIWQFVFLAEHRAVTFSTPNQRSVVVDKGSVSKLSVLYEGKTIKDDQVVIFQLSVWNRGTLAVKRDNILEPMTIKLKDGQVLDTRVLRRSRDLTQFEVTHRDNQIYPTWNILEPGDGAIIQIVYGGARTATFSIEGTIEGQGAILESDSDKNLVMVVGSLCPTVFALMFAGVLLWLHSVITRAMRKLIPDKPPEPMFRPTWGGRLELMAVVCAALFFLALLVKGVWELFDLFSFRYPF